MIDSIYQYQLQKYKGMSTRHRCPRCEEAGKFTRYIDTVTGELLPDQYGKCERLDNCGYHLNPYKDGYHLGRSTNPIIQVSVKPGRGPIYIPKTIYERSLKGYQHNTFTKYLIKLFGANKASELVQRFYIGNSSYWKGATVFWIIMPDGKIAGGQVILFDEHGHTMKTKKSDGSIYRHNSWVHTALTRKYKDEGKPIPQWLKEYSEHSNKSPVPFGLPQIYAEPDKSVAVVESAKTAIIASGYVPQFNWLAIGGASYLNNVYRIKPLEGKDIILFPDKGQYKAWSQKAKDYDHLANFKVSDLLERMNADDGSDLVDYLVRLDHRDFIENK